MGEGGGDKVVAEGELASSLVIYMKDQMEVTKLWMGRRLFRTTCYDWDR